MTLGEAVRLSEELRGRFSAPYSSEDKLKIRTLYREVIGRQMRQTNCQSCFHDAVIEICLRLKKTNTMAKAKKYTMRAGFIISCPTFHNGTIFTNDNLTDKIAEEYIKQFPAQERFFDIDKSVKVEEKPIEVPAEEKEVNEQPKSKKKSKR